MSRRKPCSFYQRPGGCRKGENCEYLHTGSSDGSPQFSTRPPTAPERIRAPNGICNLFWTSGQCTRNFDCRFKHERQTPVISRRHGAPSATDLMSATSMNRERPFNATEVHNHLGRFLRDDYRFASPNDMYAFISLLGHATKENNWSIEDGQLFLTTLATPGNNGLLRLGDIVRYQDVVINAGISSRLVFFQRAYVPLLVYFASEFVVKSQLHHNVNALYTLIHNDFEAFSNTIKSSMEVFMTSKTFCDPQTGKSISGISVFGSISTVLFEYLTRFRHATAHQPAVTPLAHNLRDWLDVWFSGINSIPPSFEDTWASQQASESRVLITNRVRDQVGRIVTIVDREQASRDKYTRSKKTPLISDISGDIGVVAYLETGFIGPGDEREGGPRHNNDFSNISDIRIAPTHQELTCQHPPFLPANLPNAPHHLQCDSMERLLDIQFRLLREELIAPLRTGIQLVMQDLPVALGKKTILSNLLAKHGGRYIGSLKSHDSLMFNVYTGCQFTNFELHPYRGLTVEISLDAPPGSARSTNGAVRSKFWDGKGGKRLLQGGLFALIWGARDPSIYLGVVASSTRDLALSAKNSNDGRVKLQVSFFDTEAEVRILQAIKNRNNKEQALKLFIEAPVMYETIRPFLTALCAEPTSFPFNQYLTHPKSGSLATIDINPPAYAANPAFTFDLRYLFKGTPAEDVRLNVMDSSVVDACRQALRAPNSCLDPSQADALVDALTREIALIQGPPGTGKTYIGVELIRVLLTNGVGPLLMIAFTNHALDHMLSSVLDAGITKKIVRLGSRSTDERISKFNLENLEMVQGESRLDKTLSTRFRELKETQREMNELMSAVRTATVTGLEVDEFIKIQYPDDHASLHTLPQWVATLFKEQRVGGWQTVGTMSTDDSLYGFWENGNDIHFLTTWKANATSSARVVTTTNRFGPLNLDDPNVQESSEDESESTPLASGNHKHDLDVGIAPSWMQNCPSDSDVEDEELEKQGLCEDLLPVDPADLHNSFLAKYNLTVRPEVPTTDRILGHLLGSGLDMWRLSRAERIRLSHYWKDEVRRFHEQGQLAQFSRLRQKYENARIRYNEVKDQSKVRLLKEIDIVGCTTTGAAKLNALLKSFSPKILIVEEAGQVLEAHVIGSLVPSVEHLILIGDPLQLRPNLANYNLSVDSKHGAALYRFDVSLMERLSLSGLRMSQLEIQRRMRPCIAELIRGSLYPRLQDHELTKQYPSVRGMAKNLFFMSHKHRETGGGEDSVSKHNMFEVEMTVDLVLHFLRQGSYSHEGDIVVLCAYLGQLVRMRDALAGKVVTVIDARDQETIAAHEEDHEDEPELLSAHPVSVTKKVLLRTVDNYQGEEAAIIILSLVRNFGSIEDEQERVMSVMRPSIGFLKSRNRTNVALSRAKHGLYIMGNADHLASQSHMWKTVIDILDGQGSLGIGFPISCVKHPEEQHEISAPGMLPQYSPDGGCLRPCKEPLSCGHICPYKCHSDDPDHRTILCNQNCLRLCPQGHPCNKLCSETCGNCQHPIFDVTLPCGHVSPSVPCHLSKHLSQISCRVPVIKSHSTCEHKFTIACGKDVALVKCREPCGTNLNCCGRSCTTACGDCQLLNNRTNLNSSHIPRLFHEAHPCRRNLFCGHPCGENCSESHKCTTRCGMGCRQSCEHATCKQACHVVCAPCAMPCSWTCPHQGACPVPCGSVCARLPCDIRCSEVLSCGHRCPSLCGEPCSICVLCAPPEKKKDIVDFIMQTTMEELVPGDTLDTLIFTLSCGHSFTVETLDGVCELEKFYNRSANKWLGLALPDPGFRRVPVCPTCRSSIDVPRYGRAIKRGALDLAEHNVVANMSHSLEQVKRMLDAFDQAKAQTDITQAIGKNMTTSKVSHVDMEDIPRLQGIYLQQNSGHPIPVQLFRLSGAKKKKAPHHVPRTLGEVWKIATDPLLQAYSLAIGVVSQRSAHIVAYENAFATLYQEELLDLTNNPTHMPRQPTENAMRVARIKVGQPPPRAEKRFSVDALWLSFRIRFLMGELAESMLKAMEQNVKWSPSYRSVWARFIRFIYRTCCQDVLLARDIAMKSESHRQIAVSGLLEFRATFELLRFDVQMWAQQQHTPEERNALLEDTRKRGQKAKEHVQQVEINYLSSRPKDAKEDWMKFKEWVVENIREPALKIIDQWHALEKSIAGGTFYSPVSLDELTQVATSFTDFTTRGHWYLCPNGHIYTIGECGGAMEQATCPECGSRIGGTNHNLETSNRRAEIMDGIERRQGLDGSPWRWNRDA